MSRTRTKRKKIRERSSGRKRTSNIIIFKVVDPIIQGLLLLSFIFSLDNGNFQGFDGGDIMNYMIGYQLFSGVINLFFKKEEYELILKERILYLIIAMPYVVISYWVIVRVQDTVRTIWPGMQVLFYTFLVNFGWVILSFWYNTICFREVKAIYKGQNNDD